MEKKYSKSFIQGLIDGCIMNGKDIRYLKQLVKDRLEN